MRDHLLRSVEGDLKINIQTSLAMLSPNIYFL